jgi:hypothetical protein
MPLGNDWIILDGGGAVIDNMQMRKVILRNVYVVYNGGPLQVQEAYFMNCTFAVRQQSNGERFALEILKPSPATTLDTLPSNAHAATPYSVSNALLGQRDDLLSPVEILLTHYRRGQGGSSQRPSPLRTPRFTRERSEIRDDSRPSL